MAVQRIDHPLVQHKITLMRDKMTGSKEFRELVAETAMLMCYEATRDLPTKEIEIATPMGIAKSKIISGRKLAFVPILRAGLGMMDGLMTLVPAAKVGHIGLFRDTESHEPVEYYVKLPEDIAERDVIVVDPMLATGHSAVQAIRMLKQAGVANIKFMCIIASPEGIATLQAAYPEVDIYCGAEDQGLNVDDYIVPGMGDAGDRLFGTK